MVRTIPAFPPVEGLATYAEVSAGQSCVVVVTLVVVHPLKPDPGAPAQLYPYPGQTTRSTNCPTYDSHGDTLPVSLIIMNESTLEQLPNEARLYRIRKALFVIMASVSWRTYVRWQ